MHDHHTSRRRAPGRAAIVAAGLVLAAAAVGPVSATSSIVIGPSTTTAPYVLPVARGVQVTSILTVADAGSARNGYELVGIPDGLGAVRDGANLTLYMNHELRDAEGIARRHGQAGAFVSRWVIDRRTLRVKQGSDFIDPGALFHDYPTADLVTSGARFIDFAHQDATFGRFCSGTLSDPGLFYNEAQSTGYRGQVWFANEEDTDNGRVFGVLPNGITHQLPRLGLFSWENTVPAPNSTNTTLVMGQEDGPGDGSQVWAYVGRKLRHGSAFAKAGLTNGQSFVLDAVNEAISNDAQWRAAFPVGTPGPVNLAIIPWNQTGAAQNVQAIADGLSLNRVEDGHWDPNNPNDFYFVTTEGGQKDGAGADSRDGGGLWRLRFTSIENPHVGATLTLLLDGSETIQGDDEPKMNKPDNMTIDTHGNILIQEDPGANNHVARIVAYRISDGALGVVARFDPALFAADALPAPLTVDEESSGIIDAKNTLGDGWFLFDAQVHTATGLPPGTGPGTAQEFVQRGQLMAMRVRSWANVYGD